MKKALSLVLAAVMAFSLVACGGSSSSTASAGSTGFASGSATASNVTVQIGPNPESIDPALNSTIDGGNMLITAFEGLLIVDENNQVQPGQAESWEVSEDGLTWIFHLREGLKWSDGTDLDATDFVYTYKRVADPDTAAPYSQTAVGMIAGYPKAVAEYLQQCYKEVLGIDLQIEIVEWSSFTPMRRAGDYEMARNGWSFDYNDPSSMLELFMTGNANNDGQYSNPEFDQMMENIKIADKEQRFANLHAAEEIVMEDYAMIPVAYYNDFWLQGPDLQGSSFMTGRCW